METEVIRDQDSEGCGIKQEFLGPLCPPFQMTRGKLSHGQLSAQKPTCLNCAVRKTRVCIICSFLTVTHGG
jgi:hypothetical protein